MVTRAGRLLFSCSALAATVWKQSKQSKKRSQCPKQQKASNLQLLWSNRKCMRRKCPIKKAKMQL